MSTKRIIPIISSERRCLNCNRILRPELEIWHNDGVFQDGRCGYRNHFEAIDDYGDEQTAVRILPMQEKTKNKVKASKREESELFPKEQGIVNRLAKGAKTTR
jgi:hypothetical protein